MFVAIETSTDYGSVALGHGPELAGEVVIGVRSRHAESLLPALEFLLETTRTRRTSIAGVVVGAGPGSFTGVRVAAATARGLAAGLGVPLHAFSSLMALAADAPGERPACAVFDARRGEVYAACYEHVDGTMRTILEPDVLHADELRERLRPHRPIFIGEGARRYASTFEDVSAVPAFPRAAALLRLAAAHPDAGRIDEPSGWEPNYLRASGAERGIAG